MSSFVKLSDIAAANVGDPVLDVNGDKIWMLKTDPDFSGSDLTSIDAAAVPAVLTDKDGNITGEWTQLDEKTGLKPGFWVAAFPVAVTKSTIEAHAKVTLATEDVSFLGANYAPPWKTS